MLGAMMTSCRVFSLKNNHSVMCMVSHLLNLLLFGILKKIIKQCLIFLVNMDQVVALALMTPSLSNFAKCVTNYN